MNPRGRTYFWTSPEFHCPDPHPDTDVTALAEQYITVTPLKFDLTDHARLGGDAGLAVGAAGVGHAEPPCRTAAPSARWCAPLLRQSFRRRSMWW